jgi:uncharacterized protein YbcI
MSEIPPVPLPDDAGDASSTDLPGGELNAAIARAVVRAYHESVGRGPTKAHAFFRGNVVVVVLEDVMTTAEHTLVTGGQGETVTRMRSELHASIRPKLLAVVEDLTGSRVEALMSDVSLEPDMAVEVFVLDQPVSAKPSPVRPLEH